jgi:very-short-patch-repair endonuclease
MDYRKKNHGPKPPVNPTRPPLLDPVKNPEMFRRAEGGAALRYARDRYRKWKRFPQVFAELYGTSLENPLAGAFTVSEVDRMMPAIYEVMEFEWRDYGTDNLLADYDSYEDWLQEQTEIIGFLRSGARPDDGAASEPLKSFYEAWSVRPAEKPVPPRVVEFATAMAGEIGAALRDDLKGITGRCESPVEQLMLLALARCGLFQSGLVLIQQADILSYRADFLIGALASVDAAPHWAVVECDGHDFHERTPEQAEHDRARDRAMTAAGYRVFRFTGREIWRDPRKCAEEVMAYLRTFRGGTHE